VDWLVEANISEKCAACVFRADVVSSDSEVWCGRRGSLKETANWDD
jgi:hypothetical protein